MKLKVTSLLLLAVLAISAMFPGAARAQAVEEPQTIVEIAAANPQFKTLVAAVQAAGLVDTLNGDGPFTVFAPTDAAFNKLGKATIDSLLADPEALKSVLLYHVLPGETMAAGVLSMSSAKTVEGSPVVFKQSGNQVYVNNARVTTADVQATNGVIHVIDTVITPPSMDIVDTAAANPQFKTLVAAVQAAGLVDTLKGEGPFTVFAPDRLRLQQLGKATIDALLADPEALKSILLYHAVSGAVYSGDAAKLASAKTVNGADVVISQRNGQLYINGARVVTSDILTTNGVIHVIDTVITPPSMDIVEAAAANPNLTTLVAAVQAAGLVDTLKGEGPFTVFAPTDFAFNQLGKATIDALLADPETLKSILLYHALPGKVYSGDAAMLTSAKTVNGAPIVITQRSGQLYINGARVTVANVQATNGVIHLIDTVITPPTMDIVDTAAANPQFKTLVAAVQAAGLVDTLKGDGPFTVFAPTDAAFNKLGKAAIDSLLADPEALKSVLLYHAASGAVYSGDVAAKSSLETVNGADVVFTSRYGSLYVNDARITTADILTTNGVIHVIDTVITPPTMDIVDTAAANPQFKTLVAAVQAAGLVDTLKGDGPFTVFAPTDAAFNKLGKATIDSLLADPEALKNILLYHAVSSAQYSGDLAGKSSLEMANGAEAALEVKNGMLYINGARIVTSNIQTSNGVIHVIDTVITPPAE